MLGSDDATCGVENSSEGRLHSINAFGCGKRKFVALFIVDLVRFLRA